MRKANTTTENADTTTKKANRQTKASVFEDLFSDTENLLELYRVLHPEDEQTDVEDFEYLSLTNIMTIGRYNDLGFLVKRKVLMLLTEAQSVWSVNILPREIMYLAETWNRYFTSNKLNIYGPKPVKLPKVEMYVIYTGTDKIDKKEITLSEEFYDGEKTSIEATVKVVTYHGGSDIVDQYISFCRIYDEQLALYQSDKMEAVRETIRICMGKGILTEYLEKRKAEVMEIMFVLHNQEYATEMMKYDAWQEGQLEGLKEGRSEGLREGRSEGLKEGRSEGLREGNKITAKNLARIGMSHSQIAEIVETDIDTVTEWLSNCG